MPTETPATPPQPPAHQPQYMTTKEVAELLRKSISWVKHRVAADTIPHRTIGRSVRFIRKEIEAWVESQVRGH